MTVTAAPGTTFQTMLSDEEVLAKVNHRFDLLAELVHGVCQKQLPGGIVLVGEKGLGKSHTVHKVLDRYDPTVVGNEEMPEEQRRSIKRMSGKVTPLTLFNLMKDNADENSVLLFDDCDAAWEDLGALNLLKAALDTRAVRTVTWGSTSKMVPVPDFNFKGSIIVITNAKSLNNSHYAAFLDRVHSFKLMMNRREKILRIKEIARLDQGGELKCGEEIMAEVVNFFEDRIDDIGDRLSVRSFVKAVHLAKFSHNWRELIADSIFAVQGGS